MDLQSLQAAIRDHSDTERAHQAQRYFKTGPGQYGEGDVFLGIRVPVLRKLARAYRFLPLDAVCQLMGSVYHEERLTAVLIMVEQVKHGDASNHRAVYDAYLGHVRFINNWDLVDLTAGPIVGAYLRSRDRGILQLLARSENLWERRIAMIATSHFIAHREFDDAFAVADILLNDSHDLIHKAVGWMLREIGKRDLAAEEAYLIPRYRRMPRTMLRYAIERFDEPRRQAYLTGQV